MIMSREMGTQSHGRLTGAGGPASRVTDKSREGQVDTREASNGRPERGRDSLAIPAPGEPPVTFLFVQQSKTQNGPALRFSLLVSEQGLTVISGGIPR